MGTSGLFSWYNEKVHILSMVNKVLIEKVAVKYDCKKDAPIFHNY